MRYETIKAIVEEAEPMLRGHFLGKVFQTSNYTLVLDFGLRGSGYLLLSVEPARPRLHLTKRPLKQLEKQSRPQGQFAQAMRANIGGAKLLSVTTHPAERIVKFSFSRQDETGRWNETTLVAQLTGRSANLCLLGPDETIIQTLRDPKGPGQQLGEPYKPPPQQARVGDDKLDLQKGDFPTLSAAADDYFRRLEASEDFANRTRTIQERLRRDLRQREKLKTNLQRDLATHGDAEKHKRLGELLLANIYTADRNGEIVRIKDFYAEGEPLIELVIEAGSSLQDEAARYFSRYAKSKRAKEEIAARLLRLDDEVRRIQDELSALDEIKTSRDENALAALETVSTAKPSLKSKRERTAKIPGVRRYVSSDGYEILVGRAATTNDRLTFKVARPHDVWLHAADYPGSHVIVRNINRQEIPHRTIVEAAQLAARFSQAGEDAKVNVNYAERKFISKPKGAAPGLVRMSAFHTLVVAPGENIERLEN